MKLVEPCTLSDISLQHQIRKFFEITLDSIKSSTANTAETMSALEIVSMDWNGIKEEMDCGKLQLVYASCNTLPAKI